MSLRPFALPLLLALTAAAPAPAPPSTLIPVACTGTVRNVGLDSTVPDRQETRIYVLDDQRRTILGYSPRSGGFRPLCDGCRLDYGPLSVGFTQEGARTYELFLLDRAAGTVTHVENRKEVSTSIFDGQCQRTAMPRPDTQTRF